MNSSPHTLFSQSNNLSGKYLEWILVILSSVLLGIWAAKETIALRNILLISETLLSVIYIANQFKHHKLKAQCDFWRVMPFLFLALTFIWVATHYLFFSIDSAQQLKELKSTWLRSFMASIVGLGTGLALRNHPNRLNLLWAGIFVAFAVLFYQYIPRAIFQQKFLVPDYDHYLFHLKINTVLMGAILLAGIDGALFDHLRNIGFQFRYFRWSYLLYWFMATAMALWAFVYIVDARNGIGLSTILYGFWFGCATIILIQSEMKLRNLKSWFIFLFAAAGLLLILYFAFQQTKVNSGWANLVDDAKIAVQIERYPNWQNLAQLGYPKRDDGKIVTPNTYERVAWATAGSRAILGSPLGVGVLSYPFKIHPMRPPSMPGGHSISAIATHSGWVELGLSFGLPILVLIFGSLLLSLMNALSGAYPAKMTILGICILTLCFYTVGEATIDHGLEVLFFLLALPPALMFTSMTSSPKRFQA